MLIIKKTGEKADFDIEKFKESLRKSGAFDFEADEVYLSLQPNLYEGITTKEIYKMAFRKLKTVSNSVAAKYSLKKALKDLGPAGYYFEKWTAKFLDALDYKTINNVLLKGKAVSHEADVIAWKDEKVYWVECKFRNESKGRVNVKTPMYILSRVKDISMKKHELFGKQVKIFDGLLVTNGMVTSDAISFSKCYNLGLLSWDYPVNRSLKNIIDVKSLYPVTCLTSLSKKEKELLLKEDFIVIKDILSNEAILKKLNIKQEREVIKEIKDMLKNKR